MTWFKVDDTLSSHPKARAAGLPAMGLWVVAGAYAGQYLTEGHVPDWYVDSWPDGKKLAAKLVEAGLWSRVDDGWAFHQWHERQPTKEQVEIERAKTRERQQRWRDARRDSQRDTPVSNGVRNGVTNGVANGVTNASPTRPDPTRPVVPSELQLGSAPTPRNSTTRATRIPDVFPITELMRTWANQNVPGINIDAQTEQWRDHHTAKGTLMKDWNAAWRTWMRNATKFGGTNRPASPRAERTDLPECWR